MASRRLAIRQLMAAERVGANDLELERARARRDAQAQGAALNALDTLAETGVKGAAAINAAREESTSKGAATTAARYKGNVGSVKTKELGPDGKPVDGLAEYDFTPEVEAKTALAGDESYKSPAKTGDPLRDFFSDPFDWRRSTKDLERRKAEGLTAAQIAEARIEQKKTDLAAREKESQRTYEKGEHALDRDVKREGIANDAANRKQTNDLAIAALTEKKDQFAATLEENKAEHKREDERARTELERKKAKDAQDARDAQADREQRASQEAERIRVQRERIEAIKQKAKDASENKGLSPKQAADRTDRLELLEQIAELRRLKKGVSTGRIGARKEAAKQFIMDNTPWTTFLEQNTAVQRAVAKNIEGGRLTDGDAKAYQRVLLDPETMSDAEYEANLALAEKTARRSLQLFDQETARSRPIPSTKGAVGDPESAPRGTTDDDDFSDFQ